MAREYFDRNAVLSAGGWGGGAIFQLIQTVIETSGGNQFCVRAGFDDATVIQHNDVICLADSGKPMCDDQCRAILH